MHKGAAFQTTDGSESRCTDHIPQAFVLSGRNRCIAATGYLVFQPGMHTTGRWASVLGNQLLLKTDQFHGAVVA
jgi:hypothetical protein